MPEMGAGTPAKPRKKVCRRTLTWALLLIAFVVMALGGCSAHRRPPVLTAQERLSLRPAPLPYSVAIKPSTFERTAHRGMSPLPYAQALAKSINASAAFRSSRLAEDTGNTKEDLIATSTGTYCNSAVIPLYTILSLGIVPTVFDDEDCIGLDLRASGAAANAGYVRIDFRYKGRVVMGWAAAVIGLLPGWRHGSARNDPRFKQRLRLEIMRNETKIEALTGR